MQTGLGWTDINGDRQGFTGICLAPIFNGHNPNSIATCSGFHIDLTTTLKKINPTWKADYRKVISLAYSSFGMSTVFKKYVMPNYKNLSLSKLVTKSIKDGKLYVDADIPYLFFLMLLTIVRYAGERRAKFAHYKYIIEKNPGLSRKKKAFVLLCVESISPVLASGDLLMDYDSGHSLAKPTLKTSGAMKKALDGLRNRINRKIEKPFMTLRELGLFSRTACRLNEFIIPSNFKGFGISLSYAIGERNTLTMNSDGFKHDSLKYQSDVVLLMLRDAYGE